MHTLISPYSVFVSYILCNTGSTEKTISSLEKDGERGMRRCQGKIYCVPSSKLIPESHEGSFLLELTLTVYTEYDTSSLSGQGSSSPALLSPTLREKCGFPTPKASLSVPWHASVSSFLGDPTALLFKIGNGILGYRPELSHLLFFLC